MSKTSKHFRTGELCARGVDSSVKMEEANQQCNGFMEE
jgi:hypothetical protein